MSEGTLDPAVELRAVNVFRYAGGAQLILANAEALFNEAQLLGQAGSFARAASLHQISMEECAKIDSLGAAATSILMGHDVDEERLARAFRSHQVKNFGNAYNAKPTEEELVARQAGDWQASGKAFREFQKRFHAEVNDVKNSGLYVEFKDGEFIAPQAAISESTATDFMHLNAYFLRISDGFIQLLHRIASDPKFYASLVQRFDKKAQTLRVKEGLNPEQIIDVMMNHLYDDYMANVTAKATEKTERDC